MEKVQKINFIFLIISGLAAFTYAGMLFIGFPVLFLMMFDSPQAQFFSMGTMYGAFGLVFYQYRIFTLILFAIAYFFYKREKYPLSIILCILTVIGVASISYYNNYEEKLKSIEQKKGFGTLLQESPASGYLVPTSSFVPNTFKETGRRYGNASVNISYESISNEGIISSIEYAEESISSTFHSPYAKLAEDHRNDPSNVYQFKYDGRNGHILKWHQKGGIGPNPADAPDHNSFALYWDDKDKMVRITLRNVLETSNNPEKIATMLKELKRVP